MRAPVAITCYNRAAHLKRCVESLLACNQVKDTVLYIASDGPASREDAGEVEKVRQYIRSITGFARVVPIFHDTNQGVLASYNQLLALVFHSNETLIFLEDDVIVAPDFLEYMNKGLQFYQANRRVFSISAFSFAIFHREIVAPPGTHFTSRFYPWGFATWRDRIEAIPSYTKNDIEYSLADTSFVQRLDAIGLDLFPSFLGLLAQKRMLVLDYHYTFHMVRNNLVTVVPYLSKSFNIGHDGSGTRTKKADRFLSMDTGFLKRPGAVEFSREVEPNVDNRFNQLHFQRRSDHIKRLLHRLGLLSMTMRLVSAYKSRKSSK